jgi:hypothetical protein
MAGFFGPERVKSKTRIESLEELSKRGVDVPGMPNPHSPKTAVEGRPMATPAAEERTNAIGAPLTVQSEKFAREQRSTRKLMFGVAAALVVGIGGTVVAMNLLRPDPPPPAPQVTPQPLVAIDAGAPVVAVAPQPEPEVDAGSPMPEPEVVDAGVAVAPPRQKPVTLTTALVQRGISQNKARFQKCFKDNKAELPSPQGTLKVQFAIASTGKVSSASTDLSGTKVSSCIEKAVKGMVFPRHVDLEVRVPIALSWDVR